MNVYDFDKTIYKDDSTRDFYLFCLKRNPKILKYLPYQITVAVLFSLKILFKTRFKEKFFVFFQAIRNIDDLVEEFWNEHEHKINKWYLAQKQESDLIISASPEFLLLPICKRLGIKHLMASRVDKYTGKYTGENCYGEEKVRRFKEVHGDTVIDEFYSDSLSDAPMAGLAKKSFIVEGEKLTDWDTHLKNR